MQGNLQGFAEEDFSEFEKGFRINNFLTMTRYDKSFKSTFK